MMFCVQKIQAPSSVTRCDIQYDWSESRSAETDDVPRLLNYLTW